MAINWRKQVEEQEKVNEGLREIIDQKTEELLILSRKLTTMERLVQRLKDQLGII